MGFGSGPTGWRHGVWALCQCLIVSGLRPNVSAASAIVYQDLSINYPLKAISPKAIPRRNDETHMALLHCYNRLCTRQVICLCRWRRLVRVLPMCPARSQPSDLFPCWCLSSRDSCRSRCPQSGRDERLHLLAPLFLPIPSSLVLLKW